MNYYEKLPDKTFKTKARVENILNYHNGLNKLVHSRVNPSVNMITREEMTIFKDKINWKSAGGQGFGAHQDQPAWDDFPPNKFVTAAMFVNETTIENGCLEFAEDSNEEVILDYEAESSGSLIKEIEDSLKWKSITTTSNDLLIFDSYVPHRSGPNTSNKSRSIIFITYNNLNDGLFYEDYFKRKRIELPPDNEREEGKEYKIKGTRYNLSNPIV